MLPEAVQVFLGEGKTPDDIVPVLSNAVSLARDNQLRNLIVVSGHGDPVSAEAVSRAIEQMHALGVPSPFKVAFVAHMLPQYAAYHFAERYAQRFGILAKVLVSIRDARQWLGLTETHRSAAGPNAATTPGTKSA
jgi:hypothetical protein